MATVLTAILLLVLVCVTTGGAMLGSAVVARHRAQSAADLAALAAARALPTGPVMACRQAQQLVDAIRATMQDCVIDKLDVVVSVSVTAGVWAGWRAGAAARAGPERH